MNDQAEDKLTAALKCAKDFGDRDALAQAHTELANYYRSQNMIERLAQITDERICAEKDLGPKPAHLLVSLAGDYLRANKPQDALATLDRVEAQFGPACNPSESRLWLDFLNQKTEALLALELYQQAADTCRQAVSFALQTGYERYSDYWEAHAWLAAILEENLNDSAAAITERESLISHFRRTMETGELNYNALSVYIQSLAYLGNAYRDAKQPAKAVPLFEQLLRDVNASTFLGPNSIEYATTLIELGKTWDATSLPDKARSYYVLALSHLVKNEYTSEPQYEWLRKKIGMVDR